MMNNRWLILIIPASMLVGFAIGFIMSFPERLEIDYGSNVVSSIALLQNMTREAYDKPEACYDGCMFALDGKSNDCIDECDWQYGNNNPDDNPLIR